MISGKEGEEEGPTVAAAVTGTANPENAKMNLPTRKIMECCGQEGSETEPKPSTSSPLSQQEKVFLCLFCQARLELDPSLAVYNTDGGNGPLQENLNYPTDNFIEPEKSEQEAELKGPILEDLKHRLDLPSAVNPLHSSLTSCNWNLLELIGKSNTPLEVPMCKKCATLIASDLQKQLAQLEAECISYKQSLDQLVKQRNECPFDQDAARRKLETLKVEERELMEQLAFLEEEEQRLNKELDHKIEEKKRVNEQDEQLYRQLRDNHRTLIDQSEEQHALKLQIRHAEEQIQRLTRTNVLDLVFHIWVDGEYGTISGFRLGRLRHDQVEWNEINAALGQMVFLLKVISERLEMSQQFVGGYELCPCGNSSFIRRIQDDKMEELPLYGGGGWRPFGQPALDKGLVAFLDCFIQVEQRLKQYFPPGTQLLPYLMFKDKIVDKDSQYLVKMQLNSEERWTKAMKCLLLNLKRVIGILITLPSLIAISKMQSSPSPQGQEPKKKGANAGAELQPPKEGSARSDDSTSSNGSKASRSSTSTSNTRH